MSYLFSMLAVLVIGMAILMAGIIMMNKESEQSPYGFHGTFKDSLIWGGSFFFTFGSEFLALSNFI